MLNRVIEKRVNKCHQYWYDCFVFKAFKLLFIKISYLVTFSIQCGKIFLLLFRPLNEGESLEDEHLQEVGLTLLHVKSDVGDHYTVRTLK